MAKRKTPIQPEPSNWVISDHIVINGRHVTKGTELSISGARGRYRFIRHVQVVEEVPAFDTLDRFSNEREVVSEWIDVIGGATKTRSDMTRSFRPDRVRRVHRVNKTRANAS